MYEEIMSSFQDAKKCTPVKGARKVEGPGKFRLSGVYWGDGGLHVVPSPGAKILAAEVTNTTSFGASTSLVVEVGASESVAIDRFTEVERL